MNTPKCYQCGGYFDTMWGDTCNGCRVKNEQHKELVDTLKEKDSIKALKEQNKELMDFVKNNRQDNKWAKELIAKYGKGGN